MQQAALALPEGSVTGREASAEEWRNAVDTRPLDVVVGLIEQNMLDIPWMIDKV
jgi:hypothetical protein